MKLINFTMKSIRLLILLTTINGYSATTCNFDVKLEQLLYGGGFHRNMTYHVTFGDKYGDSYLYDKCYIGLHQTLPAGVFAYPDELRDLKRMNKLMAISINRVNVELPAEQSRPTSVFIMGQVQNGEASLWLPIHARYHKAAKAGGVVTIDIEPSRVFIRCPHLPLDTCEPKTNMIQFLCNGVGKEICTWKKIHVVLPTTELFFAVPIGNLDDNNIVTPLTIGAVIMCTLYLLITLHEYKLSQSKRRTRF